MVEARVGDGAAPGWTDLTHVRTTLDAGGRRSHSPALDDPHLRRAHYDLVAGPADPDAAVRIGVMHSPEPFLLQRFADDGYDLVLAGHTHGGQVRIPFGPAIVTNCGIDRARARWLHQWDEHMYFHVCAGLGTGPYTPDAFRVPPGGDACCASCRAAERAPGRAAEPAAAHWLCWPVATGVWRSLVACFVRDEEAAGSNPVTPTRCAVLDGRTGMIRASHA